MLVNIFHFSVIISTWLVILLGVITSISLLLLLTGYLFNFIYKRTQAHLYFISFVVNRKEFIKWKNRSGEDAN